MKMYDNKLVNTKEAARVTGLSAQMLRQGWKTGLYPAIELGGGGRGVRLRWNLNLLNEAIMNQFRAEQAARINEFADSI